MLNMYIEKAKSFSGKIVAFLKEVELEMKKVSWLTKKEVMAGTSVVIIVVFIIALFLGIVDISLSALMNYIIT